MHCVSVLVASSAVGLAAAALSVAFWDGFAHVFVPRYLPFFFYSHRGRLCCLCWSPAYSELPDLLSFAVLVHLIKEVGLSPALCRDVLGCQVAQQMQQLRRMKEKSCSPGQKQPMLKELHFPVQYRSVSVGIQADAPLRERSRIWLSSRMCFRDGCPGGFLWFRRCPEHLLPPPQARTRLARGPFNL